MCVCACAYVCVCLSLCVRACILYLIEKSMRHFVSYNVNVINVIAKSREITNKVTVQLFYLFLLQ